MDSEFLDEPGGLRHALDVLRYDYPCVGPLDLPSKLPETGLGPRAMLDRLAPNILGGARVTLSRFALIPAERSWPSRCRII